MADAVFPFPGGKSRFASWILDQTPGHTCFVEAFGGATGILPNKDPATSDVEVYNDRDGDPVQVTAPSGPDGAVSGTASALPAGTVTCCSGRRRRRRWTRR